MADEKFPDDQMLDEDFIRGASIFEPSARERAKRPGPLTRLRAARAARRRRREMVRQWRSPEYRTGPKQVLTGLLVVVVAVGVLVALMWLRPPAGGRSTSDAAPEANANPNSNPYAPPPEAPFRGSPAEKYADNAAGIRLPQARAAAGFTATEVRHRLEMTKGVLGSMHLEREVWGGARPKLLFDLTDPKSPGLLAKMRRAFDRPSEKNNPLHYAVRFDPQRAKVHGPVVKVHGTTTYRAVRAGQLRVHVDYLFVYAVRPAAGGDLARVVVRRTMDVDFYDPERFQVTFGKLVVTSTDSSAAGAECGWDEGWLRPYFGSPASGPQATGAPVDPYDMSRKAVEEEGCAEATRV
ncbi:hypothetical protein DPM19_25280 [Actinomadura craniellae]|uniref:Uncharacterized protein n=1 Tax=Actinomadura craniellae TaxID=2231787 RepID=A0A365H036_9ACTN|nr:hypothetical protein DPM19_25280 [Actinomadura craniellae]